MNVQLGAGVLVPLWWISTGFMVSSQEADNSFPSIIGTAPVIPCHWHPILLLARLIPIPRIKLLFTHWQDSQTGLRGAPRDIRFLTSIRCPAFGCNTNWLKCIYLFIYLYLCVCECECLCYAKHHGGKAGTRHCASISSRPGEIWDLQQTRFSFIYSYIYTRNVPRFQFEIRLKQRKRVRGGKKLFIGITK